MRKPITIILMFISTVVFLAIGCEKDKEEADPPNQNNTCKILYPIEGQEIIKGEATTITVEIGASDELISEVVFLVDDIEKISLVSSPYTYNWSTTGELLGTHSLKVSCEESGGFISSDVINIELVESNIPQNIYPSNLINPSFLELQDFYDRGYDGINGNLELTEIDGLLNMLTLSNIKTINGHLIVSQNPDLISFEGLENLTNIGGDLILNQNRITNIDALSNLTNINGDLHIIDNALTNIDGLSNIISVSGDLIISGNYHLVDLCGIKTLLTINGVGGNTTINSNLYNPSVDDIIAGNCSL